MGFRPRVSETRVYTLHHSPKKTGAAGATCTLTRLAARRFLRPPGLLFHARPQSWSRRPESHRHGQSRPTGFEAVVSTFQPRREEIGADRGNRTLMGFRPSAPRADVSTVPPRPQKMEHPQGRAPCCLSYQDSPSLSTGWMHGRSGRTCTFVARQGIAFTARCICCSATLRKMGLERDSHPRPSPYEGAALTAAPPSQIGGDRGSCSLTMCRVRAGCPSTVA